MELAAIATVLAALGGVVKLVLDALNKADERHDATLKEQRAEFTKSLAAMQAQNEKFLGNHMSGFTHSMENVAIQLEALTKEVRDGRREN